MKTIKIFGFFTALLFVLTAFTGKHDFHTSTTKIEFNKESSVIKITSKYFTDDLEKAIGAQSTASNFNSAAKNYLQKHFKIRVNGKDAKLNFLGAETTDKAARIYLEIHNVQSVSQLEVYNNMLIDLFADQQNFIDLNVEGKRKSAICRKNKTMAVVSF